MKREMISVLIPCHNYGIYLKECIESVLVQKGSNIFEKMNNSDNAEYDLEIIVVDDGSEDNTAEICGLYKEVKYIYQKQSGVSHSRNTLLKAANGDYIAFLDADDVWVSDKLQKQYNYLKKNTECMIVGCEYQNFESNVPTSSYHREEGAVHLLIPSLIKRSVFEKVGMFDESLKKGEDTDLIIRMRKAGIDYGSRVDEVLLFRRKHELNISNDRTAIKRDIAALLRSNLIKPKENTVSIAKECGREHCGNFESQDDGGKGWKAKKCL